VMLARTRLGELGDARGRGVEDRPLQGVHRMIDDAAR